MLTRLLFSGLLVSTVTCHADAQWSSGGLFSVFNHFQAAIFQSPDTGLLVYGSDNPISGEGGVIVTYDGLQGGGFYLWYEPSCLLEDVHVVRSNGFPYYMAAGTQQNAYSLVVRPYSQFQNPFQLDSVRTGSGQFYRSVRMRNDLVAFAGGGNSMNDGIIDMSVDTGATWTNIATFPDQVVSRIRFANDMLGFATTGGYRRLINNGVELPVGGKIYRSTDGGMNWNEVYADAFHGFSDVAFSSPTNGIASRNDGQVFRTTDGGSSWTASTMNFNDSIVLTAVTFRSDGVGFATGYKTDGSEGVVLISSDGGGTWDLDFSTASLNHARRIYGITFHDLATGYVSTHIRPLKSNGISTAALFNDPKQELRVGPNPTDGLLQLLWEEPFTGSVEVTDAMGRVLSAYPVRGEKNLQIDISDLDGGEYYLTSRNDQERIVARFVKF